jgi:hypothetical protein
MQVSEGCFSAALPRVFSELLSQQLSLAFLGRLSASSTGCAAAIEGFQEIL